MRADIVSVVGRSAGLQLIIKSFRFIQGKLLYMYIGPQTRARNRRLNWLFHPSSWLTLDLNWILEVPKDHLKPNARMPSDESDYLVRRHHHRRSQEAQWLSCAALFPGRFWGSSRPMSPKRFMSHEKCFSSLIVARRIRTQAKLRGDSSSAQPKSNSLTH